jgi:preprotein translocase subunit SecE
MADNEIREANAKARPTAKAKAAEKQKGAFLKKIKKGILDIRLELKRVTWPTWKELFNYTVTTLVVCAIMGVLIYVLDISLQQLLKVTLRIGA